MSRKKAKTMQELSYGIWTPQDLLEKLIEDGEKLAPIPHPHALFNFLVTAASLHKWILKTTSASEVKELLTSTWAGAVVEKLPAALKDWLLQYELSVTRFDRLEVHVTNAVQIARYTANASKHFHWRKTSVVAAIDHEPVIKSWSQYFFTPVEPGLFVEANGKHYSVTQLKQLLIGFYSGVLATRDGS